MKREVEPLAVGAMGALHPPGDPIRPQLKQHQAGKAQGVGLSELMAEGQEPRPGPPLQTCPLVSREPEALQVVDPLRAEGLYIVDVFDIDLDQGEEFGRERSWVFCSDRVGWPPPPGGSDGPIYAPAGGWCPTSEPSRRGHR